MNDKKVKELLSGVSYEVLDNGFKIISYESQVFEKTYINYCTNYGSLDYSYNCNGNDIVHNKGIAHFLEHIMFNMPYGDAFEKFSNNQASANAYTSYNKTSYLFEASENVKENLYTLLEMVNTFYLPEEKLEKERGIILEEIGMYDKQPFWKLYMDTFKNSLKDSKYKDDILGFKKDIETMSYDMLKDAYDNFYTPNNQFIVLIGPDLKESINLVKSFMQKKEDNKNEIKKIIKKECLRKDSENEINLDFNQSYVSLVYKKIVEEDFVNNKNKLAMSMVLDYLYSDLNIEYVNAIENRDLDYTFDYDYVLYSNYFLLMFFMENKNEKEIEAAINKIKFLNIDDEDIIKNKYLGKLFKKFNNHKDMCEFIVNIENQNMSINQYYDMLIELKLDDVIEILKKNEKEKISTKIVNKML